MIKAEIRMTRTDLEMVKGLYAIKNQKLPKMIVKNARGGRSPAILRDIVVVLFR
jgi:hypothetical protein